MRIGNLVGCEEKRRRTKRNNPVKKKKKKKKRIGKSFVFGAVYRHEKDQLRAPASTTRQESVLWVSYRAIYQK